ncbi:MAG: cbb3-type cytochrome c oxidase N-terminal domain-containing protein [Bacteroidia bacterium]
MQLMNKKYFSLAVFILLAGMTNAQDATKAATEPVSLSAVLIAVNLVLLVFLFLLLNILANAIKGLKNTDGRPQLSWWDRFAAVKSEKTEEELILDEDFDGISELDNPTPPWFNFIFYTTIIVAVIYLFNYHYFKFSKLQDDEYKEQVAVANAEKEAYLKSAGNLIDENSVKLMTDEKSLTAGATLFKEKCAVCHGDAGEGKVGPNFTDDYWIHGGSVNDIFKTIKYGVPAKGMISWQNSLNGQQMQDLASFIKSLRGTKPANPKEAQGDLYVEGGAAAPAADSTATDSTAIASK